jgi:hypothetical protein
MRKFQVGDRVRWYEVGGHSLWSFNWMEAIGDKGYWTEGYVTSADPNMFAVDGCQIWPQPDHESARYGEPGYLELVEVVSKPRCRVVQNPPTGLYHVVDDYGVNSLFPESCLPELEALCVKLNKRGV